MHVNLTETALRNIRTQKLDPSLRSGFKMEIVDGVKIPPEKIIHLKDINPGLDEVRAVVEGGFNSDRHEAFEQRLSLMNLAQQEMFRHALVKELGNQKFTNGEYSDAIHNYIKASIILLGNSADGKVGLPSFGDNHAEMYNKICGVNGFGQLFYTLTLAACYNNIAQCYIKLGNLVSAIDWIQEVVKLYALRDDLMRPDWSPWTYTNPPIAEFPTYYIKSQLRLADILHGLGNTASSAHCSHTSSTFGKDAYPGTDELERLRNQSKLMDLTALRHPDFKSASIATVIDPKLQIRGSWKRIHASQGCRPRNRAGFSSWIWRSCLYIQGGTDHCKKFKHLFDFWCIDLKTMKSWRRLPEFPPRFFGYLTYTSDTRMRVWNDDAWLFFGNKRVFKFDMVQEKWVIVETKWDSAEPWPYSKNIAIQYCAEIFEGKLHIFAGANDYKSIGMNLHMCLDLKTLVWTRLGGSTDPQELIAEMPMFRKFCSSWVDPLGKRLYILYGLAARPETEENKQRPDHQYEDMWSYSLVEKKWRRERLRGNFPAPRAKMACAYHPTFHQVLIYGGCSVRVPMYDEKFSRIFYYDSHIGDTFILDMKSKIWKQVITRKFPHHRLFSQMNVDDSTGKIYLYGGSCSSELMPSKNADEKTRTVSLGDLWCLDIDFPGEKFDDSEFQTTTLVDSFGPWKLCFGCKEYKADDMRRCGGTCGGRIYLCSTECQKRSWKEHKCIHLCSSFRSCQ